MRWPWRRRPPAPHHTSRDPAGRLIDGDTVRPPGQPSWTDLLAKQQGDSAAAAGPAALTEHTAVIPVVTPAARLRGWGRL